MNTSNIFRTTHRADSDTQSIKSSMSQMRIPVLVPKGKKDKQGTSEGDFVLS